MVLFNHLFENLHHPFAASVRWYDRHLGVIEHKRADAVPHAQHPPGGYGGNLSSNHRFHTLPATEKHADPLINKQPDGAIFFFRVNPDIRCARARGYFPVDIAGVVTGQVITQFFKIEPAPSQL